jgi:acetyl-CoA C-acetyltransferase
MKALMFASASIATGHQDVIIAGGMESMSNVPYYVPKARNGYRYGHGTLEDGLLKDGLWDVYNDQPMGNCGEKCANDFGFDRESQDDIAIESYKRAIAAGAAGRFDAEIAPIDVKTRKGVVTVTADEEYTRVNLEKVRTLRPAFKPDGTVTAANASPLSDGASALMLMSASKAKALGLKPIGRVRGYGDAAQAPEDFTTAPSLAMPVALKHAGLSVSDVDFFECNEAFAVVLQANMKLLGIDHSKINVNGGAVAMGHPIGSSGARIVVTLLNVLQQQDGNIGGAMICNGGGGASAIVVERI